MSLLVATDLGRFYGADEIFSAINLEISASAHIGLVGPNGAGKTSLIDILAGLDLPTSGSVAVAGKTRLGYLPQRPEMAGAHSLWQEQLKAFADLRDMEGQLTALEDQLAAPDGYDEALERYGNLQAEYERRGGYEYESRIKIVLSGLGFAADEYHMPLPQLSGGQKTRAMLCRLLLEEPDLLLLDEPTNHLDIRAVEWLETYLKSFPGAVLAVSHDRYFLDNFATTIWELEYQRLLVYRGNYSAYLQQRDMRRESLRHAYYWQQQFIDKELEFVRRHMGSRRTAQAKGRLKKLETMRKRGKILESGPRHRRKMSLEMGHHLRSGDQVLMTEDLRIGYDAESPLMTVPDALVLRGETVALIGPNGVGKSTFLKTLAGDLAPLGGQVTLGAKVKLGYFAQAHEKLNRDVSILDEIRATKKMPISAARDYLGRFMFSNDDVFRPIASLSGGERGRVALAKLTLLGANLLLLDEPTNHLDIDSQEVLQAVLEGFTGTILLASHDRYLVDALATQVWEMTAGDLTIYDGDYQAFLRQRSRSLREPGENAKAKGCATRNGEVARDGNLRARIRGLNPYEAAKRAAELESMIDQLERDLSEIDRQLHSASLAGDAESVRVLGEAYIKTQADLESRLTNGASSRNEQRETPAQRNHIMFTISARPNESSEKGALRTILSAILALQLEHVC